MGVLLRRKEAGTGFGRGAAHLVVAADEGLGKLLFQFHKEAFKRTALRYGAGVLGIALRVQAALVADAYGAAVEGTAMGTYLVQTAVTADGAVAADVVVVTDVDEASGEMVATEALHGIVLGLEGGRTVDYQVVDGLSGHENARLYTGEEALLGGNLVTGYC